MEALQAIPDPEMPISIADLGLIENVRIQGNGDASRDGHGAHVGIDLIPTFIGCPALEMIAGDIQAKVGKLEGVAEVMVNWLFDPPWTVDRITQTGRESLKAHGVTVPERGNRLDVHGHRAVETIALHTSAAPCPFCGSTSTYLDSPFGPTRCRTIFYCQSCRNSFERLKRV